MSEASEDMGPLGAGITPVKVEPVADAGAKEPPKKKSAGCATSHSASGSASTSSALVWLLAAPALGFSWRRRRG
jgi:MYXO-CTERM domain-containing protein